MHVSLLRRLTLCTAMTLSLAGLSSGAAANTVFTVQLGSFESEKEARAQWEKLETRFPDLFGPLNYASAKVQLPPDDFVYFRTQAGPLTTRSEADEICQRLTVKGFECYVAETAMFNAYGNVLEAEPVEAAIAPPPPPPPPPLPAAEPEQETVDLMEAQEIAGMYAQTAPTPLPAPQNPESIQLTPPPAGAQTETVVARAPSAPEGSIPWSSVAGTSPQPVATAAPAPFAVGESDYATRTRAATPQPAPVRTPRATLTTPPAVPVAPVNAGETTDIKVAEAVAVPLTDADMGTPTYSTQPPSSERGFPSQQFRRPTLWAEISYFSSQNAALGYWRTLRSRDSMIPNGLRLRVVKPLKQHSSAERLSLRIGPFDNANAIRRLCSHTAPEKLGCKAMRDIGSSVAYQQHRQRQRINPADRYKQRHNSSPFSAPSENMYWIQLGAFSSMSAAQSQWGILKGTHNTLSRLNEQVIAPRYSSSTRRMFRLQAGPFARSIDAVRTCTTLKRDGLPCIVVPGR